MGRGAAVDVRPIGAVDAEEVCRFLNEHLNPRVSPQAWAALLDPPWAPDDPNHGFLMRSQGVIVGVYLAVYSRRDLASGPVSICNQAAFCVLEEYRAHGLRLARALLAQKGYEFTDLSPSGNVTALNERLGFRHLDTTTRLVPNLPAPNRGVRISSDPERIERRLAGADAGIFRDHRRAPAVRHLLIESDDRVGYLMFRRDRRKGLPLFATPLHAGGDEGVVEAAWPAIASRLLLHHRLPATLAERRVLGFLPRLGVRLEHPRPRMFRSERLGPEDIDYLYSELTLVEW